MDKKNNVHTCSYLEENNTRYLHGNYLDHQQSTYVIKENNLVHIKECFSAAYFKSKDKLVTAMEFSSIPYTLVMYIK